MVFVREATPVFQVKNVQASVAFYSDKLGFIIRHQEGGSAIVRRNRTDIILTAATDERWRTRQNLAERPVVTLSLASIVRIRDASEVSGKMAHSQGDIPGHPEGAAKRGYDPTPPPPAPLPEPPTPFL
jgi:catechol 2,3-dioxygenase-like lactoylglutathione lyase family enzyme